MNFRIAKLAFATAVFTHLLAGATIPSIAIAGEGRSIVLGRITQEPGRNLDRLQSMADYLAGALAPHGINRVEVVIADGTASMEKLLAEGKVDLFSETPFSALELMRNDLAEPLLREWKKGVPQYHTVIVARRDGDIRTLADLRGHKFAFEDSGSTSGYFLPRHAIESIGLSLHEMDDPRGAPPADGVGYSFAKGEINVVAWVNRGLADGGAISNLDWANPEKAPERLKENLTIIHETPPVVRSLMMVRRSLDRETKQRLVEILTSMHETEKGRAALKSYFKVSRYDAMTGDSMDGFEHARNIWRQAGERDK